MLFDFIDLSNGWAYLAASLAILPLAYILLYIWMQRTVEKPPRLTFFFIFGSLGGYLLLRAFAPSFVSMMVFVPFLCVAFIAVLCGTITSIVTSHRSGFHVAAAVSGCLLLLAMGWCATSGNWGGMTAAGKWDDDPKNWSRAFDGQTKPPDVTELHSRYWKSLHFTDEWEYFFQLHPPPNFLEVWISSQNLGPVPVSKDNTPPFFEQPSWFLPKPVEGYELWLPRDDPYDKFRIYRDRTTGDIFVTDCST